MGKMLERKCRNCGNVYKFESSASFIVFCPYCMRFDYFESEYISPVTECTVFIKTAEIIIEVHKRKGTI